MKNLQAGFLISALIILFTSSLSAQSVSYQTRSGLVLGFGAGSSYQVSDIKNSRGIAYSLWLGSQLTKKENSFLAIDWKFRFMAGNNSAYDHRINPDNTYSNIQLSHYNYDFELSFTLNRLRERSGIITGAFISAGISHMINSTNLLDESNNPYNYLSIDQSADRAAIVADLRDLTDDTYETALFNRAAILPGAGIYLGYSFSKSFSMGFEYKIIFSPGEDNGLFGINMDNRIASSSCVDMLHYAGLGFRWNLRGKSSGRSGASVPSSYVPVQQSIRDYPVVSKQKSPDVDITIPYNNPHFTSDTLIDITARVMRVSSRQDISVKLNGEDIDFDFNPASNKIQLSLSLPGDTSRLDVICKNTEGTSSDDITIIYKEIEVHRPLQRDLAVPVINPVRVNETSGINEVTRNENFRANENIVVTNPVRTDRQAEIADPAPVKPPRVSFINPRAPVTVRTNIFNLRARAENVDRWQDIEVLVNGSKTSNFNFTREGIVSLNIGLKEGINRVEIRGSNKAGTVAQNTSITYNKIVSVPLTEISEKEIKEIREEELIVQEEELISDDNTLIEPVTTNTSLPLIRINPGNASWQFCMVTPSGRYNRDNLKDSGFTYSGSATSLFIMPTGGGGTATVNGKPYKVKSGQYYLFTGKMTVTVSNKRPGSMGQWSVTIISSRSPATGKGNKRPKSPCEN